MTSNAVAVVMDAKKAQILTEEISRVAFTVTVGLQRLHTLVSQAKMGNAHIALGYPSWPAYLVATLNDGVAGGIAAASGHLTLEERRELVAYLAGEGMSTRAIAPIVGVGKGTVHRDLAGAPYGAPDEEIPDLDQVGHDVPPEEETPDRQVFRSGRPGVVGLDGKRYAAKKRKATRRPLPTAWQDALCQLGKDVERLERLAADDRFPGHRDELSVRSRHPLANASKKLWKIRGALGGAE